jgi:hypothetical protein
LRASSRRLAPALRAFRDTSTTWTHCG